jgi:hypothetical protein
MMRILYSEDTTSILKAKSDAAGYQAAAALSARAKKHVRLRKVKCALRKILISAQVVSDAETFPGAPQPRRLPSSLMFIADSLHCKSTARESGSRFFMKRARKQNNTETSCELAECLRARRGLRPAPIGAR